MELYHSALYSSGSHSDTLCDKNLFPLTEGNAVYDADDTKDGSEGRSAF